MSDSWKYVYASVAGTSHTKSGTDCQDSCTCSVFFCNGLPIFIGVVADGAGSALNSKIGASIACDLFLNEIRTLCESGGSIEEITRSFIEDCIASFQNHIKAVAEADGKTSRDYACTFLSCVIGKEYSVFAQIGDGAIVVSSEDEPTDYRWVFWPQQGEYANQTFFITDDDAINKMEYIEIRRKIDEVALFSDGLQGITLNYEKKLAHTPFFSPSFAWLRPFAEGHLENLSHSLELYFNSPIINEKTDDDKTLILATRRFA